MNSSLPLNWADKKNSPLLADFIAKYGTQYCMTAEEINQMRDAVNEMSEIQKTTFLGVAEPTDTPTGTGRGYWEVITPGTYTNFGAVVLAANERGLIARDAAGLFKLSKVGFNFSNYATKTYVDNSVLGLFDDRGNYDASVNVFPTTGGSGPTGNIVKGDWWYISVPGTLGGKSVKIGASLRSLTDAPGQTITKWQIFDASVGYIPENTSNKKSSISASPTSIDDFPNNKAVVDYVEENKNNTWVAKSYASGAQVNYLGKDWVSSSATLSTDIPGTSIKWMERLSAYVDYSKLPKYPFYDSSLVPNITKNSIINVEIVGGITEYYYSIYIIQKAVGVTNRIRIQVWDKNKNPLFFYGWLVNNYVPTNDIERIKLLPEISTNKGYAYVTIDWSKIPNGTSSTSYTLTLGQLDHKVISNSLKTTDLIVLPQRGNLFRILLPKTIRMLTGNVIWVFWNQIISDYEVFKRSPFYIESSTFKIYGNYGWMDRSKTNTEIFLYDMTDMSIDNRMPVLQTRKIINLNYKAAPTNQNFNLLTISDSYFDYVWGAGIQQYLKDFAAINNNTFTFKGTRTSTGGDLGENRASWTALQYTSKYVPIASREPVNGNPLSSNMSSPFVFSTDDTVLNSYFSFAQYVSSNALTNLDNILIFLGVNSEDGNGNDLEVLVNGIKADSPDSNVFICLIPQWGEFKGYPTGLRKIHRDDKNADYIKKFDNRESEKIYLIATNANFNNEYDFINEELDVVQFQTIGSEKRETLVNSNHPTASGAKAIAYMIYNTIANI